MGALWYPTLGATAVYSDNPDSLPDGDNRMLREGDGIAAWKWRFGFMVI